MEQKKGIKEAYAEFFENPDRIKFRDLIKENTGEYNYLDFKEIWIEDGKLAKHILGMANNEGGVIVFGVEEKTDRTLKSIGLSSLEDKTKVSQKLRKFIPEKLMFDIHNFDYAGSEYGPIENMKFQVLIVEYTPDYIPFTSISDGSDIQKNHIYYRNVVNTEDATYEQLQDIINRRIETGHSTKKEFEFRDHLACFQHLLKSY
jgi:predicted HTH transcriptional regulator